MPLHRFVAGLATAALLAAGLASTAAAATEEARGGSSADGLTRELVSADPRTHRVAGGAATPTAVAVALADEQFPDRTAAWAVVARDDNFADALTAAVVADARGPVLYTGSRALAPETLGALERSLQAGGTVYVMGGEGAIAPAVVDELETRWRTERVAGSDRVRTALAADRLVTGRDRGGAPASEVLVAAAFRYPDALAGGVAAVRAGAALLLVNENAPLEQGSNADLLAHLDAAEPARISVLGGTVAVPAAFDAALRARADDWRRVAGDDRAGTAALLADPAVLDGAAAPTGVTVVNGYPAAGETDDVTDVWGYALAASARGATLERPLLLVHGQPQPGTWDGVPVVVAAALDGRCDLAADVVGAPSVVSDATLLEVERLRCSYLPAVDVTVAVTGLQVPWAVADLGEGRVLVTERDRGHIRLVRDGALVAEPVWTGTDLYAEGEAGLMGMAADGDTLYVCQAIRNAGGGGSVWLLRLQLDGDRATTIGAVGRLGDAAVIHNGCAVDLVRAPGENSARYVVATLGDANNAGDARVPSRGNGKVHRFDLAGQDAPGNAHGSIWTIGHRNPQGIDQHPVTGAILAVEHGPTNNDEINVLVDGGDYGWPAFSGPSGGAEGSIDPIWASGPTTIATAGAAFASEPEWQRLRGALFVATLKDQSLRALPLVADGTTASGPMVTLVDGGFGRLRAVAAAAGGGLWVTTSNCASGCSTDVLLHVTPR